MTPRADISPTRLATFEECPARFRFRHVLRLPEPRTVPMDAGTLAHAVLERAARWRVETRRALAEPVTLLELHAALDEVLCHPAVSGAVLEVVAEHLEVAAPRISFEGVASDADGPLLERAGTLDAGDGVTVGLRVDAVELHPDVALVRDWKFSRLVEEDPAGRAQVGLYAVWARRRWPDRRVAVELVYPVAGVTLDPVEWGEALEAYALQLARAVVKRQRTAGADPGAWPARVGLHCRGCGYQDACPAYRAHLRTPLPEREPEDLEGLVPALAQARELAALWKGRADALRDRAKPLLAEAVDREGLALVAGYKARLATTKVGEHVVRAHVRTELRLELIETPPATSRAGEPAPPRPNGASEGAAVAAGAGAGGESPAPAAVARDYRDPIREATYDLLRCAGEALSAKAHGHESPQYRAARARADVARDRLRELTPGPHWNGLSDTWDGGPREGLAVARPEDPKEGVGYGLDALLECACGRRFQNKRALSSHRRACAKSRREV